ncbi:Thiol-activated cytolysin [Croceitalea dokdonensis DOKDO 023]|uniref:Thiol-activated cytolysin n=1 Tax=Croceitalea dokdonensis DOKDO 023 TaxID=1300341 RepID=A0A0P7B0S7_9FLAO|nr:thiol-activated cytolysin family protein [Croceitalea dokdonensis]KPM31528.1 Thiol-activated cytolysin [Croceitalea dokdonensis DOKDO 023]
MKTSFKRINLVLGIFLSILCITYISCSTDETPNPPEMIDTDKDGIIDANDDCPTEAGPESNSGCPNDFSGTNALAAVVASGNDFENFPSNTTETEIPGTETTQNEDYERKESADGDIIEQRWICTEKEVDITGGTQTFPLYNTNASVIWPGNLLQGKTLDNATPQDITVKRAGGKITYNLVTGNPQATVEVDVVDQGTVQQAMNDVIAQNGDITPANFTLDVVAINSREELALEMGLKVSTLTTKVSGDFSLDTSSEVSSVLVKLTQQYYTMSYVKPTSLDEVFDPSVTPEQLATFIQPDNAGTFISSVTYGRIFYMLYESTASAQDMEAALKGSYNAVAGKASASVDIESLREYNNLNVKVIAYGGDSQGTLNAVGATFGGEDAVDNLQDIVERLAESSDIAGGLPLSYVVNSLENPSQVVSTNLATRYTVKTCELKGVLPPQTYQPLLDLFSDDEDGGGIGAMVQVSRSNVLIFNKMGDKYAWYNGATASIKGIFGIKEENSPLGVVPFDKIGAATQLSDSRIYFFDETGLNALRFSYDKTDSGLGTNGEAPTEPIGTFLDTKEDPFSVISEFGDSGNFPFVNNGFEAGVRVGVGTLAFFGKPGDEYALYTTATGAWQNPLDSETWYSNRPNQRGTLFERVGAAAFIEFSDSTGRWLLANEEGNEIMEYQSTPVRTFDGPWVIN